MKHEMNQNKNSKAKSVSAMLLFIQMSWKAKSFFWEFSGIFIKSRTRDKFFLLITIHVFEQTRKHFVCSRTFQWMLEVMQMGPHIHTMCNQIIGQPWFINLLMYINIKCSIDWVKILIHCHSTTIFRQINERQM